MMHCLRGVIHLSRRRKETYLFFLISTFFAHDSLRGAWLDCRSCLSNIATHSKASNEDIDNSDHKHHHRGDVVMSIQAFMFLGFIQITIAHYDEQYAHQYLSFSLELVTDVTQIGDYT